MNNTKDLHLRFWQYQKERLPLIPISIWWIIYTYSIFLFFRSSTVDKYFALEDIVCIFCMIGLSIQMRITDEFKDKEIDAKYRKERPVPRGLISLNELLFIGIIIFILQIILIYCFKVELITEFFTIILYLILMWKEFFIADWLKARPMTYLFTHTLLMPIMVNFIIEFSNVEKKDGFQVFLFLLQSNFCWVIIELGRKIYAPSKERYGVETYTALYGISRATLIWNVFCVILYLISLSILYLHGYFLIGLILISPLIFYCTKIRLDFIKNSNEFYAAKINTTSLLYVIFNLVLIIVVSLIKN